MKYLFIILFVLIFNGCKERGYHDSTGNFKLLPLFDTGISIGAADTAYATWLGPDSVMFITTGKFPDTTIISNPSHKYKP